MRSGWGVGVWALLSLDPAYADGTLRELQEAWAPREIERIRAHLSAAEERARARPVDDLAPEVRARRSAALDALAAYREAGRFPMNHTHEALTPVFVDASGTRCAMGELIARSGGEGLVRRIAATRNDAYVADLAGDPELARWLHDHGLTVEEASRIQPSYEWCASRSQRVCPEGDATLDELVVLSLVERGYESTFRVEEAVRGGRPAGDIVVVEGVSDKVEPGARYVGLRMQNQMRWSLLALDASRQVRLLSDPCGVSVSLSIEAAAEVIGSRDCVDRLETMDVAWAGGWCTSIDGSVDCGDGVVVPPPQLPPLPSASPSPAPVLEMGSPSPSPRALSEAAPEGCTSAGGPSLVGLVAVAAIVLARRRPRTGS